MTNIIKKPYKRIVLYFKDDGTKTEFKRILAGYKNSEVAIKDIIEIYNSFKSKPKFI